MKDSESVATPSDEPAKPMTAQEFSDQIFNLSEAQREIAFYGFLGAIAYLATEPMHQPTQKEIQESMQRSIKVAKRHYP